MARECLVCKKIDTMDPNYLFIVKSIIMKRTRGAVKTYVESSGSSDEEDSPSKKSFADSNNSSTKEHVDKSVAGESSSSESDLENYLQRPDKLDLNSEFFNLKSKSTTKEDVPDFNKIENEIFSGVTRLSESDSNSNSDDDFEKKNKSPGNKNVQSQSKYFKKKSAPNKTKSAPKKGKFKVSHGKLESDAESDKSTEKSKQAKEKKSDLATFNQLQEYTKKIEEAKKFVEIYKAKKHAEENKTDILNLLASGEGLASLEQKLDPSDLHSSDFESCDSEQEDWEEIKQKEEPDEDKNDVCKKNVEITVSMPDVVKKKKGVDLLAAMKRRLNRIRKENQLLIHKVHLLCWMAHGNHLNTAVNNTQTLGMALSLLPSEQCYPADRTDLSYLEQIVNWFKRTVKCVDKPVPYEVPLDKSLQMQISNKEAYDRKMLVLIFVAILRSLGVQCRLVISLQVEPLRPPNSELHSLSNKPEQSKGKLKNPQKPASKSLSTPSTSKTKQPNLKVLQSSSSKVLQPSSSKEKPKPNIVNKTKAMQVESKDKIESVIAKEKKEETKTNVKTQVKSKNEKEITNQSETKKAKQDSVAQKKVKSATANENSQKLEVKKPNSRSKSAENKISKDKLEAPVKEKKSRSSERTKSSKTDTKTNSELKVPKTGSRRSNLTESVKSDTSNKSEKANSKGKSKKVSEPKVSTARSKSTENIASGKDVKRSSRSTKNPKDVLEVPEQNKNRRKSSDSPKPTTLKVKNTQRKTQSTENLIEKTTKTRSTKDKNLLEVPKPRTTRKRSKSADSDLSDSSVKSDKSTKSDKNSKSEKTKRVIKVKAPVPQKKVSQVDGPHYLDAFYNSFDTASINDQEEALDPSDSFKYEVTESDFSEMEFSSDEEFLIPQLDGPSVTASKPKSKPNLLKLKKATETGKFPEIKGKQLDVRNDIISLVKGRINQQKQADKKRLAQKRKSRPVDDDSDSDYAPEPIKKKHHDSEDEFKTKVKVKRRIPGKSALLAEEAIGKKKKIGNDYWVEVFLESEEKWICVDLVYGQVHCVKEVFKRATQPVSYVLAWSNDSSIKDVTQRYCENFNTVTRKLRIDAKWWTDTIKPFLGKQTARDKEEDNDLARQQMDQPLPKTIAEYKNHPLYVLKRHLLKFEGIYPPEPPTLGFARGEEVYPRGCVFTLHSRDIWLKQAKVVKMGEQPYKIVRARPKWDKLSNTVINDQMLEIFGPWQVEDYVPPNAENGKVPRNAFGNVDLFKPCMLPGGCVHLKLPGLNKIARKLNIDCVSAIVGFDFHSGWSVPVYDGFIVCKEFEETLINAWDAEQIEIERKEQEKIEKRVYGNWKRLIKGLLIRERLKAKYDFGEPTGSGTSKDKKKRSKGPTFCTKKRRVCKNSESDST